MRYTNSKLWKILCFPVFTHFNLPGKCVFSAVNSGDTLLFTRKMQMNERKTRCLPCVNRAVNAGKWIVYLHLPRRKTTEYWNEYWDWLMRKRTENVGFSVGKTRVHVSKLPRYPWIQPSFSVRWTLVFLPCTVDHFVLKKVNLISKRYAVPVTNCFSICFAFPALWCA